jgi:hypothetical protein
LKFGKERVIDDEIEDEYQEKKPIIEDDEFT